MTLTRKDFFKQGFYSLGETLLKVVGPAGEPLNPLCSTVADFDPGNGPVADVNKIAQIDNQHCLARNFGCFSCVDRCESGAIYVVMGEGVRIDSARCTGCGICEYVCPVMPKALQLIGKELV